MIRCPSCGKENSEDANFYVHCTKKLRTVCNCWVKKGPYNCGQEKCPEYKALWKDFHWPRRLLTKVQLHKTENNVESPLRTNGRLPRITVKYPQHPPLPDKNGKGEYRGCTGVTQVNLKVKVDGYPEALKALEGLENRLKEARTLANELASLLENLQIQV